MTVPESFLLLRRCARMRSASSDVLFDCLTRDGEQPGRGSALEPQREDFFRLAHSSQEVGAEGLEAGPIADRGSKLG